MENDIIKKVKKDIIENYDKYPFISRFWDFKLLDLDHKKVTSVSFGHFGTRLEESIPFNKPLSKIIDPKFLK